MRDTLNTEDVAKIEASEVHRILNKTPKSNEYVIVCDLTKSNGPYLYDAISQQYFLDMQSFGASFPLGYNHPELTTPRFLDRLAYAAINNPKQPAFATVEEAQYWETSRRVILPEEFDYKPLRVDGNLVDMVHAQRILEIIEEDNLVENATEKGRYILEKLHDLQKDYSTFLSNVRGRNIICCFDLKSTELRDKLIDLLYISNVLVGSCDEQSICLRPPLNIGKQDIDKMIVITKKALEVLE